MLKKKVSMQKNEKFSVTFKVNKLFSKKKCDYFFTVNKIF